MFVTVSVCRSKTLIGAAISPHCTSAACQMETEGIWYSAEWMRDQLNAHWGTCTHKLVDVLLYASTHTSTSHKTFTFKSPPTLFYMEYAYSAFFFKSHLHLCLCMHVCICSCCLYVCNILASFSSCWHLIFTHQLFSRWLNTAVRCAAQHLPNICPSCVV